MRKHKSDRLIGILTFLLMGVGLIVIYAIGPQRANFMNSAYGLEYDTNYFFTHQLMSVALSVVAFVAAFRIPYQKIKQYAKWIILAGIGGCIMLGVLALIGSSLASCQLGACRWIRLGGLGSFQPAELLKLGLVVYLAQLIAKNKETHTLESGDFLWPFTIVSAISLLFVVVLQKDLGTGICIIAIIFTTLWMSGIHWKYFMAAVGIILAAGVLSVITSPHRMERLLTFSGGGDTDSSYHIDNAKMAIGTGGLFGVGVGNSVQATGYLPESINDSVFAVMGETFGFVGLSLVVGCFTLLLVRILRMLRFLADEDRVLVSGVFAWVMAHVVVNISAMTGLIPLTGITLPLLSFGGTSMMFIATALGMTMQISCYTSREPLVVDDSGGGATAVRNTQARKGNQSRRRTR